MILNSITEHFQDLDKRAYARKTSIKDNIRQKKKKKQTGVSKE